MASCILLSHTVSIQAICATDTSNHLSTINRASAVKQTITNRCIVETDFKSKGTVLQHSVINKRSERISRDFFSEHPLVTEYRDERRGVEATFATKLTQTRQHTQSLD